MSNPSIAEIAERAGLTESQLVDAAREPGPIHDLVIGAIDRQLSEMRESMREVEQIFLANQ